METNKTESPLSVLAAIIANIAIGIVKFIAGGISNSTAMISEGIHSVVDSGNGILVLVGIKASKKEPDIEHPYGYGKNLYFYSFIVGLLIFALGGGISLYEGYEAIKESFIYSYEYTSPTVNYIVLGIAFIIEGFSLSVALKEVNHLRGELSFKDFVKKTKDPSNITVLLEDTAAELGLIVAFFGVFFTHLFENKIFDGIASMIIGCILISVALILIKEVKGLLIGEGLDKEEVCEIEQIVLSEENVLRCGSILSMYVGPDSLLMNINVSFKREASETQILKSIENIEQKIKNRIKDCNTVERIFIEVDSLLDTMKQDRERDEMIKNSS